MAPKQFKKSNSKNETRIKIDNKNRDKTGKNYKKSTSKKSLRLKKGITNKRRQAFYLVFIYAIYVIVDSIFYEIKGEGVFDYLTGDNVLEFDLNRTQLYFKDKIGQYIGDDDTKSPTSISASFEILLPTEFTIAFSILSAAARA